MNIRKTLLAVSATVVLAASGATAAYADPHYDRDRDHRGHATEAHHDRYWREGYHEGRYVDRDRVYMELRRHHYNRFVGDPYWYNGRYVVRSYDRHGHVVYVEVNPYTGGFVGVVNF